MALTDTFISRADGRLAGFTNQQVRWAGGWHSYVLLTEDQGKLAPAAPSYLVRCQHERGKVQEVYLAKPNSQSRGPER